MILYFIVIGVLFPQAGRPKDDKLLKGFLKFCDWFDNEMEDRIFTIHELEMKCQEISGGRSYTSQYFKSIFLEEYHDQVYVTNEERRKDVVCLKNSINRILREALKKQQDESKTPEEREREMIKSAAMLLRNKARSTPMNPHKYPHSKELITGSEAVPGILKYFLSFFLESDTLQEIWGQNFVKAIRPRSGVLPYQLGLTVQLDHHFGSKYLIEKLHSLKYCESYKELQNFKLTLLKNDLSSQAAIQNDEAEIPNILSEDDSSIDDEDSSFDQEEEEALPSDEHDSDDSNSEEEGETTILINPPIQDVQSTVTPSHLETVSVKEFTGSGEQIIADNIDIQLASTSGDKSLHALARIKVNPERGLTSADPDTPLQRRRISANEKT